jgi:hypothetical protein
LYVLFHRYYFLSNILLTRKSSMSYQAKRRKKKKPKPEEQEGMPQHGHCPPAKHRGDRNPKYHAGQQKDVE